MPDTDVIVNEISKVVTEAINQIASSPISVHIAGEAGDAYNQNLSQIIANGIRLSDTGGKNEQNEQKEHKENAIRNSILTESVEKIESLNSTLEKALKDVSTKLEPLSKIHTEIIKSVQIQKQQIDDLKRENLKNKIKETDVLTKNKKGNQKDTFSKKIFNTFGKIARGATAAFNLTEKALSVGNEKIKESFENLVKLSESGVRLTGGYTNTAWKLSSQAGLYIDDFVSVLAENSKYVNSLTLGNKLGGEDTISKGLNKIIGTFGTTEKQAKSIVKYFNESVIAHEDLTSMTAERYTEQLEKTTKNLQALSKATGLSVEQIMQKNKLEEEDILHAQLKSNDDEAHTALRTLEFSKKDIEYIMLGTMSSEIVEKMAMNPEFSKLLNAARQAYIDGGATGLKDTLSELKLNVEKASRDEMQMLSLAGPNSIYGRKFASYRTMQNVNAYDIKKTSGKPPSKDEEMLDRATKYNADLNRMYNETKRAFTLSIEKATDLIDKLNIYVENKTDLLNASNESVFGHITQYLPMALQFLPEMFMTYVGGKKLYKYGKKILKKKNKKGGKKANNNTPEKSKKGGKQANNNTPEKSKKGGNKTPKQKSRSLKKQNAYNTKATAKARAKALAKRGTDATVKATDTTVKVIEKKGTKATANALVKTGTKANKRALTKANKRALAKANKKALAKATEKAIEKKATEEITEKLAKEGVEKATKIGLKKIPGVSILAGLVFGAQRAMAGDWVGAGLEVVSGAASTIPGLGTAASSAIDLALMARDVNEIMKEEKEYGPQEEDKKEKEQIEKLKKDKETKNEMEKHLLKRPNKMVKVGDDLYKLSDNENEEIDSSIIENDNEERDTYFEDKRELTEMNQNINELKKAMMELPELTRKMISQLERITNLEVTLTDRAVVSQGR